MIILAAALIAIVLIGTVVFLARDLGRDDAELKQEKANDEAQKRKDAVPNATTKSVIDKLRKRSF